MLNDNGNCFFLCVKDQIERLDPRNRTPIQLAVCLGRLEAARILAQNDADCCVVSKDGWNCEY